MIANEKQYRITRKKAQDFAQAIEQHRISGHLQVGVDPRLLQAEREAMESQLQDLRAELSAYEQLKSAELSEIRGATFEELADGLIKARIASGLNQRELAERMDLKEQQVQRYEAERYATASYTRLCEVANALGVRVENKVVLPRSAENFAQLLSKVGQVGLRREFVIDRLLNSADAARAKSEIPGEHNDDRLLVNSVAALEKVFGWSRDELLGAQTLPANFEVSPFITYAKYLAATVNRAMGVSVNGGFPSDADQIREMILFQNEGIDDLRAMLATTWNMGVAVLPLREGKLFGGGCWRTHGHDTIVLKPELNDEPYWMMDLLRNLFYVVSNPNSQSFEFVDAGQSHNAEHELDRERAACRFAGDVMLRGIAEKLYQKCQYAGQDDPIRFAEAIQQVSKSHDVDIQRLATYISYRRRAQKFNWLEARKNYKHKSTDGWTIARDVFIDRFSFQFEDEIDRLLLDRAVNG